MVNFPQSRQGRPLCEAAATTYWARFLMETETRRPLAATDGGEFVAASLNVSQTSRDEMCSANRDCKCRLSDLSVPPSPPRCRTQMLGAAVWHRAPHLMKMRSGMEEELMTFNKSRWASIFSVRGASPLLLLSAGMRVRERYLCDFKLLVCSTRVVNQTYPSGLSHTCKSFCDAAQKWLSCAFSNV